MTAIVLDHGSIDDVIDIIDDFGRHRCDWRDSVCTETIAYQVEYAPPADPDKDPDEPLVFCPRHYAVWLARFATLHGFSCHVPIYAHFARVGQIGTTGHPVNPPHDQPDDQSDDTGLSFVETVIDQYVDICGVEKLSPSSIRGAGSDSVVEFVDDEDDDGEAIGLFVVSDGICCAELSYDDPAFVEKLFTVVSDELNL